MTALTNQSTSLPLKLLVIDLRYVTNSWLEMMIFVLQFQTMDFYEVYRISKNHSLSMAVLCRLGVMNDVCDKPAFIWERRKNLTGVHFNIGVLSQGSLLAKDNKVYLRFVSDKHKHIWTFSEHV